MRFVVDIGNTRVKWAYFHDGSIAAQGEAAAVDMGVPGAWATAFAGAPRPEDVVVGRVGRPQVAEALAGWVLAAWQLRPREARATASAHGVVNGYERPGMLGIDRWAAIIAARSRYHGGLCVVDAGTACTVDMVDPEGVHQGGWIVPGLGLQASMLAGATQQVSVHPVAPVLDWGRNTAAAVGNGSLAALAGLVETAHRLAVARWREVVCVLAGGDAQALAGALALPAIIRPALVLEGLDLLGRSEEEPA